MIKVKMTVIIPESHGCVLEEGERGEEEGDGGSATKKRHIVLQT